MRKNRQIQNYTLLEILAVISLVALLFNGALFLFYNGNHLSGKAADRAQTLKSASVLTQAWRTLVNGRSDVVKCTPERIDFADGSFAAWEKPRLVISKLNSTPQYFTLPKGTAISFAREDHPGEKPLLVLYLRASGSKGQKLEDKFIRIAALSKGISHENNK